MATAEKGIAVLDARRERRPRTSAPHEYASQLSRLWQDGLPSGDGTGWPSVDQHYTVAPGQLTVLTGWPGSGKSEWLDALMVNLTRHAWKFAVFSPENPPAELHLSKLLEKLAGKPFGQGPSERMSMDEVREWSDELDQHFAFIEAPMGEINVKGVVETADEYLRGFQECKRGLVIDPWNELEHWRPAGMSETEYVSRELSLLRNWARQNAVHVWVVAHPQKVRRGDDGKLPVPRPDMISGSQHWWNKADCAVTVWRALDLPDSRDIDIHVQKVRFKHIGRPGVVPLCYDRVTGRYREPERRIVATQRRNQER